MRTHDLGECEIRIIQGVPGIDDALLGGIVERLCLFDVAARTDPGRFTGSGLIEQAGEGVALAAVGGELIGRGEDRKIRRRHPQQQVLAGAEKGRLRGSRLQIGFLQLAEGLEAPQGLR